MCRHSRLFLVSQFFFFKQKTAYEMRISDWSSDVCSSDLEEVGQRLTESPVRPRGPWDAPPLSPLSDPPNNIGPACQGGAVDSGSEDKGPLSAKLCPLQMAGTVVAKTSVLDADNHPLSLVLGAHPLQTFLAVAGFSAPPLLQANHQTRRHCRVLSGKPDQ